MSKVVFLSAGHGGSDPGAVAYGLKEKDINLNVLKACRDELKRHGLEVVCSREKDENDPVGQEVKEANNSGADIAVSFHINAGGGDGFEAFCNKKNEKGVKLAKLGEKNIKALGQNSRGIKDGTHLYFVKNTKMTSVLFETFFIDNDKDNDIGDTLAEQKKIGVAYAKAILEYLGIEYKSTTKETTTTKVSKTSTTNDFKVKVTTPILNIRGGASTKYDVKGTVSKGDVYTIVETKDSWGKLKSGKGWINLGYTKRV